MAYLPKTSDESESLFVFENYTKQQVECEL